MKKSLLKVSLSVIALGALMAACYPGGPTYVEDYDVTYSYLLDPTYDWSDKAKKVYFMPDTVVDISDPDQSPDPVANEAMLLNEIMMQLDNYGYTRETDINKIADTDFIILASRVRSNNYYYTWWGGWGGWGGWGWGGCCYYPPVATVSNYRTASLTVQFIPTDKVDPDEEIIPMIWQGVGEGLFEGSASNISNRAKRSIDQMFKQSPYLNRN